VAFTSLALTESKVPRMDQGRLRKFPQMALVVALCFSVGLHWGVVQTAAWVGMVLTYSSGAGFVEAVERTFDGNHPCKICKVVEKGKKAQSETPGAPSMKKLDPCVGFEPMKVFFSKSPILPVRERSVLSFPNSPPPVPPPRWV